MRRLYVLVAMALASPAGVAGAQPTSGPSGGTPTLSAALQKIDATYQAGAFSMWVTHGDFVKRYNRAVMSQGTLIFVKPDKINYHLTNGSYLVIDGHRMATYEADVHRFDVSPTARLYTVMLSFMSGPNALAGQCNLTLSPGSAFQYSKGYVLACDPKITLPGVKRLLFYVDAASSEIRRIVLQVGQGDEGRYELDQIKTNPPIPPQEFSLAPPPGASSINGVPVGASSAASTARSP